MGELSLFNNSITFNCAEALEDTDAYIVEGEKLKELILKMPSIAIKILKEFSKRLSDFESQDEHFTL